MKNYRINPKFIRTGGPLCEYLGVSAAGAANLRKRADFPTPYKKSKSLVYYRVSDLDEWITQQREAEK
jgi:predicted DNA-binding transcriptional regulator AlpA